MKKEKLNEKVNNDSLTDKKNNEYRLSSVEWISKE